MVVKFLPPGTGPRCPLCGERINGWDSVAEQIETTSAFPVPDPNWSYTDRRGHIHMYWELPPHYATMEWVVDLAAWMDLPEEGHYECKACRETIVPGMIGPSPFRTFIPGMRTITYRPCGHEAPNNLSPIRWRADAL